VTGTGAMAGVESTRVPAAGLSGAFSRCAVASQRRFE